MKDIRNKLAVVTGASMGIGTSVARDLKALYAGVRDCLLTRTSAILCTDTFGLFSVR